MTPRTRAALLVYGIVGAFFAFVAGLFAGLGADRTASATVTLLTGDRVRCPYGVMVSVGHVLCRVETKDNGFIVRGWDLAEVDVVDVRL